MQDGRQAIDVAFQVRPEGRKELILGGGCHNRLLGEFKQQMPYKCPTDYSTLADTVSAAEAEFTVPVGVLWSGNTPKEITLPLIWMLLQTVLNKPQRVILIKLNE